MLKKHGLLYVILDTEVTVPHKIDIVEKADQLARAGADYFQLRAENLEDADHLKIAIALKKALTLRRKTFIVNDRADIAFLSGADGLHLGETDIPVRAARKIIGPKKIIGKTCHSARDTVRFQAEAVDYTSVGPVFKTLTKPSLEALTPAEIKAMVKAAKKSIFAIGGISLYNVGSLADYAIDNVAICRALLLDKNPRAAIRKIKQCLLKPLSKR